MATEELGLYNILSPHFLTGVDLPDYIDKYLSFLNVREVRTAYDESGIVYKGTAVFGERGGIVPDLVHDDPSGPVFRWEDLQVGFRMTIPRDGSNAIDDAVQALAGLPSGANFALVQDLFNTFGAVNQDVDSVVPTEFPGFRFRLELEISYLTFHLKEWKPAKLTNGKIVRDADSEIKDVKIMLPKVIFQYEKDDRFLQGHKFEVKSWGNSGFDAPSDLKAGELVQMVPPMAISANGRYGFGLDKILLDLSEDSTPPEILEFFGTDEAFKGVYIKDARFFYTDEDKDFALGVGVKDVLINFSGEVSFDLNADFFGSDFDVDVKLYDGAGENIDYEKGLVETEDNTTTVHKYTGGMGDDDQEIFPVTAIPANGWIQVIVQAGSPPYNITLTYKGIAVNSDNENTWNLGDFFDESNPLTDAKRTGDFMVVVMDASEKSYTETIALRISPVQSTESENDGTPEDREDSESSNEEINFSITTPDPSSLPHGYSLSANDESGSTRVSLQASGGDSLPTVTVTPTGGSAQSPDIGSDRRFTLDVPGGSSYAIQVIHPGSFAINGRHLLRFRFGQPRENSDSRYTRNQKKVQYLDYISDTTTGSPDDNLFIDSAVSLRTFLEYEVVRAGGEIQIGLEAHASYEDDSSNEGYNNELSNRRSEVAEALIRSFDLPVTPVMLSNAVGSSQARIATDIPQEDFRAVWVTGAIQEEAPQVTINATLNRPETTPDPTPEPESEPTQTAPVPAPVENEKPSFLRRLSIRFKLERNIPVLMELYGELDFETALEETLRNTANTETDTEVEADDQIRGTVFSGPPDGVVAFKINVTHDSAIHSWSESLFLGAAPDARDGILNWQYEKTTESTPKLKDMLGALLIFAPLIGTVADNVEAKEAGDWVKLGLAIGVPVALGALRVLNITNITLFGGELQSRQLIPPGEAPAEFQSVGIIFDYRVESHIEILPQVATKLIETIKPVKVRYKAIGIQLNRDSVTREYSVQPIFDLSKGYELDLSDPGLFKLPDPLGNIIKVLGARIQRINPILMELDVGVKVDLGIFEIDKFKIKWQLPTEEGEPVKAPVIIPTGIKVDLSNVLVGSGYLNIEDKYEGTELIGKAIRGGIDLTLVSIKLRIAAEVSIEPIKDLATGREATAVFASILIEFPSPIVLGASGLGFFGITGLFAMHYKRIEGERQEGEVVGPALKWLKAAGGVPNKFENNGVTLWGPEFDRWSFGIGVLLGTLEGGTLLNLWGTFVLELPGPRILIFIKVKIISALPETDNPDEANQLDVGILGVLDLDLQRKTLTVGVIIDLEIEEILTLELPVELFFDFENPRNFHLYLGTHKRPAGANILNLVRAYGYFMIEGQEIKDFPPGTTHNFPGVAVATGLEAAIILGNTSIGLYLKIAVGAHLAFSFIPKLALAGQIYLEGELRLFIISIGARGTFTLFYVRHSKDDQEMHIKGQICGKVSFLFFKVEGCVSFEIGEEITNIAVPSLIKNVYLQSFAPVITSGQGTDKPIDASLGDAPREATAELPVVPIDCNIVLQLVAPPVVTKDGKKTQIFEEDFVRPATDEGGHVLDNWFSIGADKEAQFFIKSISLNETFSERPPITWRKDNFRNDALPTSTGEQADTNIDLALLSRTPTTAERAIERSTELNDLVELKWGNICKPEAPPACVLFNLCNQPLGPSGSGWQLYGTSWPDDPDTTRATPPPNRMFVEEPVLSASQQLLDSLLPIQFGADFIPAKIIGSQANISDHEEEQERVRFCRRAVELPNVISVGPSGDVANELKGGLNDYLLERTQMLWLNLRTGPCQRVKILFMVPADSSKGTLILNELLKDGTLLQRHVVFHSTLVLTRIDRFKQLPSDWQDPSGPWLPEALQVYGFLAESDRKEFTTYLLEMEPLEKTEILQFKIEYRKLSPESNALLNRVIIGIVETCSLKELERQEKVEEVRNGELEAINEFLSNSSGKALNDLLEPSKDYTLSVGYEVDIRKKGETDIIQTETETESFHFRTDSELPKRLNNYILGTTPDDEFKYHFYQDPVKIIFNDETILNLVEAYGRTLKIDLRSADGVPIPEGDEVINELQEIGVDFISPYRDTLVRLIDAGLLNCFGGTIDFTIPREFQLNATLKPLTEYILELTYEPTDPPSGDPETPIVPLFRRNFKTSRYASLEQLTTEVAGRKIEHKALPRPIAGLPAADTGTNHTWVEDIELENLFIEAGEQALPSAQNAGLRLYWALNSGTNTFFLQAIMLDAAEPLWRTRSEPDLQTVGSEPADPNFQIIVPQIKTALEIVEQDHSYIDRYVISHGGTRVVAVMAVGLTIPDAGIEIKLALQQNASTLYNLSDKLTSILTIPITKAPWEEDDE